MHEPVRILVTVSNGIISETADLPGKKYQQKLAVKTYWSLVRMIRGDMIGLSLKAYQKPSVTTD